MGEFQGDLSSALNRFFVRLRAWRSDSPVDRVILSSSRYLALFDLPFRLKPKLDIAFCRPTGLFPELVRACLDLRPTDQPPKLLLKLVNEASEPLYRGLIIDRPGNARCEFELVLDLFSFPVHDTRDKQA
jgi:hypothetical protein